MGLIPGFVKDIAGGVYKIGKTAWGVTKKIDPTGSLSKVEKILKFSTKLISKYPAEAAQIATAILSENPAIATPALRKIVERELIKRIKGSSPEYSTPDEGKRPPSGVINQRIDYNPHEFERGDSIEQHINTRPSRPMVTFWHWRVLYPYPVIEVICPWFHYSNHRPMRMHIAYFHATRGKWNRCGYCGNWSFTR